MKVDWMSWKLQASMFVVGMGFIIWIGSMIDTASKGIV